MGGKNTQLGPRFKEIEKAARSGNLQKRQFGVVKGPVAKGVLPKRNIDPALFSGLGSVFIGGPGHGKKNQEAMVCDDVNQNRPRGNLSKINEIPLVKELFGNPVSGNINRANNEGNGLGNDEIKATSVPGPKGELSEQNPKPVSK